MKLNFKQFKLPQGISHKNFVEMDVREALGNIIYRCGDGVAALSLATKIYRSDGETDYDERETKLIRQLSEIGGKPALIDGIRLAMDNRREHSNSK